MNIFEGPEEVRMSIKDKKPYVKHPRYSGIRLRKIAILNLRIPKLRKILNSAKTELDIEKFGFQLERCEAELNMLTRGASRD